MMNKKKLLSSVVASALVATQLAMPTMAATGDNSGTIDVDVTTKTPVIRVEVPTDMAIAIDQFETDTTGSQIFSTPFTLKNRSAIDVKVNVESTADATATLVASAANAATSSNAWLAVASQTKEDTYDDAITSAAEGVGDLTEANGNVTVFDATTKKATQDYFLGKGTGAESYKAINVGAATAADVADITYAQLYELTATSSVTDDATLKTAAASSDVYEVATSVNASNPNPAAVKIAKGTTDATYTAGRAYYTAAATHTTTDAVAANKVYAYGEMAGNAADGVAAFRYIGKLGSGKASWSSTDLSKVSIVYDIYGMTPSDYAEKAADCIYGLEYAGMPTITCTAAGVITISNLNAAKNYAGTYILLDGIEQDVEDGQITWDETAYDAKDGGTVVGTLGADWKSDLSGKEATVIAKFTDGTSKSIKVTFATVTP